MHRNSQLTQHKIISFFPLCTNLMDISDKLAKHNNKYKLKNSATIHNQDTKFLCGKPFNEKGKTTGPSLVKSSTIKYGFTTIFSRTNASYRDNKNMLFLDYSKYLSH